MVDAWKLDYTLYAGFQHDASWIPAAAAASPFRQY
jgi:hypothetical protein